MKETGAAGVHSEMYMFSFISRREVRTAGRGDNALGQNAIWAGHSAA